MAETGGSPDWRASRATLSQAEFANPAVEGSARFGLSMCVDAAFCLCFPNFYWDIRASCVREVTDLLSGIRASGFVDAGVFLQSPCKLCF